MKKENKYILIAIIGIILFVAYIILKNYIDNQSITKHNIDMKLYLLYSLLNIVFQAILSLITIWMFLVVLTFILLIVSMIFKNIKLDWSEKLLKPQVLAIVLVVLTLFLPSGGNGAYTINGHKVLPIASIFYQMMDIFEEPKEVSINDCKLVDYQYSIYVPSRRGRGSSHGFSQYYIKYNYNGEEQITPATQYMKELLLWADLSNESDIKVLMYPNTGIIVDLKETPKSIYADNQDMLDNLISRLGKPYCIEVNKQGQITVYRNPNYEEDDYVKYGIELDDIEEYYNGESIAVGCAQYDNRYLYQINLQRGGAHRFYVVNECGLKLSDVLVVFVEDGKIDFYDFQTYN